MLKARPVSCLLLLRADVRPPRRKPLPCFLLMLLLLATAARRFRSRRRCSTDDDASGRSHPTARYHWLPNRLKALNRSIPAYKCAVIGLISRPAGPSGASRSNGRRWRVRVVVGKPSAGPNEAEQSQSLTAHRTGRFLFVNCKHPRSRFPSNNNDHTHTNTGVLSSHQARALLPAGLASTATLVAASVIPVAVGKRGWSSSIKGARGAAAAAAEAATCWPACSLQPQPQPLPGPFDCGHHHRLQGRR